MLTNHSKLGQMELGKEPQAARGRLSGTIHKPFVLGTRNYGGSRTHPCHSIHSKYVWM
jgi:hypothetical protein